MNRIICRYFFIFHVDNILSGRAASFSRNPWYAVNAVDFFLVYFSFGVILIKQTVEITARRFYACQNQTFDQEKHSWVLPPLKLG